MKKRLHEATASTSDFPRGSEIRPWQESCRAERSPMDSSGWLGSETTETRWGRGASSFAATTSAGLTDNSQAEPDAADSLESLPRSSRPGPFA